MPESPETADRPELAATGEGGARFAAAAFFLGAVLTGFAGLRDGEGGFLLSSLLMFGAWIAFATQANRLARAARRA